jgi:hypothetical protein
MDSWPTGFQTQAQYNMNNITEYENAVNVFCNERRPWEPEAQVIVYNLYILIGNVF